MRQFLYFALLCTLPLLYTTCAPSGPGTTPLDTLETTTAQIAGMDTTYTLQALPNGILLTSEAGTIKAEVKSTDTTIMITWQHTANEITQYQCAYYTLDQAWKAVFESGIIAGRINRVMDLDQDGSAEFLVDDREEDSSGGKGAHFLYQQSADGRYAATGPFEKWDYNLMVGCCNSVEFTVREVEDQRYLEVKEYLSARDEMGMIVEETGYRYYQLSHGVLRPEDTPYLIIEENNVPLYGSLETKERLLTLPVGSATKKLSRGPYQVMGTTGDFWYEVQYEGKTGWVFGAHTTVAHHGPLPLDSQEAMVALLMGEVPDYTEPKPEATCQYRSFAFPRHRTVIVRECLLAEQQYVSLYAFQNPNQTYLSQDNFGEAPRFEGFGDEALTMVISDTTAGTIFAKPFADSAATQPTPTLLTLDHDGLWILAKY